MMTRAVLHLVCLMAIAPGTARAERAQTLSEAEALLWGGELSQAEAALEGIVQREPENAGAWIRLAQARRWTGRPLAARAAVERALEIDPTHAEAGDELAWTYADEGRPHSARQVLEARRRAPPEGMAERLARVEATELGASAVAFEDSGGVWRIAPRLAVALSLPANLKLRVGGGGSLLGRGEDRFGRGVVGFALHIPMGPAEITGGWAIHHGETTTLHEGSGQLSWRFSDVFRAAVGARRRPFLEQAPALSTDEAGFHAAGANGAFLVPQLAARGVDELTASVSGSPLRGAFAYAELRGFQTTDQNRGWSSSAGAGIDIVSAAGLSWPFTAVLRWDSFATAFAEPRVAYFSPALLDGHSAGVELRYRPLQNVLLLAEGGPTFPLAVAGNSGWFGGGAVELAFSRFTLTARAQSRTDPFFTSRRIWAAVTTHFP